jgi:hypothetical protein
MGMRRSDGGVRVLVALVVILLVAAALVGAVYGLAGWVAEGMGNGE